MTSNCDLELLQINSIVLWMHRLNNCPNLNETLWLIFVVNCCAESQWNKLIAHFAMCLAQRSTSVLVSKCMYHWQMSSPHSNQLTSIFNHELLSFVHKVEHWKDWNTSPTMRNCWKIPCYVSLASTWNNVHRWWYDCSCTTMVNHSDCPWRHRIKHSPSDTSKRTSDFITYFLSDFVYILLLVIPPVGTNG